MEHKCNKSAVKAIEKCEFNLKQVIKALECCCSGTEDDRLNVNCEECPYGVGSNDCRRLYSNALSLIKELTEESERLHASCTELTQKCERLTEENERLQKALNTDISIVRVSRGSGKTAHLREVGRIKVDAIRADTVRKMQERLDKHFCHDPAFLGVEQRLIMDAIDQTAKEMLEGL